PGAVAEAPRLSVKFGGVEANAANRSSSRLRTAHLASHKRSFCTRTGGETGMTENCGVIVASISGCKNEACARAHARFSGYRQPLARKASDTRDCRAGVAITS